MKVQANGISINYEINGKGENLILIHGMGDTLNMWYNQVPLFSKKYRVIMYDVRGFGRTESPPSDVTMTTHCEDLSGLMDVIGVKKAFMLGFSMGGRIAIEMAATYPERVKALIMANSSLVMGPLTEETLERRRQMIKAFEQKDVRKIEMGVAVGAFSPGFREKHPEEFEKYLKVKLENLRDGSTTSLRMPMGALPDISRVKCPVLFIVGEHDPLTDVEKAKESAEMIPGSKMVVFPTGHAAAIEMPEEFNAAVLKFLSQVQDVSAS